MLFKRKRRRNEDNLSKMHQIGDVKIDQTFENSSHLTDAEFARDFEECCDVEFGKDYEGKYVNDQFGEENIRRNNLSTDRDYNENRK